MTKKPHLGKNVSRIRRANNMKQETLARALGISQQAVSKMEQRPVIGDDLLNKIAKILMVSPDVLKIHDQEFIIDNITNCKNQNYGFKKLISLTIRLIIRIIKKLFQGNQ